MSNGVRCAIAANPKILNSFSLLTNTDLCDDMRIERSYIMKVGDRVKIVNSRFAIFDGATGTIVMENAPGFKDRPQDQPVFWLVKLDKIVNLFSYDRKHSAPVNLFDFPESELISI